MLRWALGEAGGEWVEDWREGRKGREGQWRAGKEDRQGWRQGQGRKEKEAGLLGTLCCYGWSCHGHSLPYLPAGSGDRHGQCSGSVTYHLYLLLDLLWVSPYSQWCSFCLLVVVGGKQGNSYASGLPMRHYRLLLLCDGRDRPPPLPTPFSALPPMSTFGWDSWILFCHTIYIPAAFSSSHCLAHHYNTRHTFPPFTMPPSVYAYLPVYSQVPAGLLLALILPTYLPRTFMPCLQDWVLPQFHASCYCLPPLNSHCRLLCHCLHPSAACFTLTPTCLHPLCLPAMACLLPDHHACTLPLPRYHPNPMPPPACPLAVLACACLPAHTTMPVPLPSSVCLLSCLSPFLPAFLTTSSVPAAWLTDHYSVTCLTTCAHYLPHLEDGATTRWSPPTTYYLPVGGLLFS